MVDSPLLTSAVGSIVVDSSVLCKDAVDETVVSGGTPRITVVESGTIIAAGTVTSFISKPPVFVSTHRHRGVSVHNISVGGEPNS